MRKVFQQFRNWCLTLKQQYNKWLKYTTIYYYKFKLKWYNLLQWLSKRFYICEYSAIASRLLPSSLLSYKPLFSQLAKLIVSLKLQSDLIKFLMKIALIWPKYCAIYMCIGKVKEDISLQKIFIWAHQWKFHSNELHINYLYFIFLFIWNRLVMYFLFQTF